MFNPVVCDTRWSAGNFSMNINSKLNKNLILAMLMTLSF